MPYALCSMLYAMFYPFTMATGLTQPALAAATFTGKQTRVNP